MRKPIGAAHTSGDGEAAAGARDRQRTAECCDALADAGEAEARRLRHLGGIAAAVILAAVIAFSRGRAA